ncbi:MAG: hypothetical protein JOZ78_25350 [Chroococcidiopsidaceae cyanobacterium CP_BM_ER_R8_30]|nr:hypothetical protein [Chroococcidiopsidaceae cyanobacterium CP_BM_ER_R8_30]
MGTNLSEPFWSMAGDPNRLELRVQAQAAVDRVVTRAQQVKSSFRETVEQTKSSLEQTLQTAGQLESQMSAAMQTAIGSTISDWLQAHPAALRLVRLLLWATNHPILSLVILLFAVAITWSLIRAIVRLLDTVGWSLLQVPLKLSLVLIGISFKSLRMFGSLAANRFGVTQNTKESALQTSASKQLHSDKQQRLAEISSRLEAIRQEQNELLQEAAAILSLVE